MQVLNTTKNYNCWNGKLKLSFDNETALYKGKKTLIQGN